MIDHDSTVTPSDRLLSIPQFAELLSVDPQTVGRMIKRGELRSVRINRLVRVPLSEFARILDGAR